jgi:hypothetical protein
LHPAHHHHARSGGSAQSERQPKLPHHILAIEMLTVVLDCLAAASPNAQLRAPVPFDGAIPGMANVSNAHDDAQGASPRFRVIDC